MCNSTGEILADRKAECAFFESLHKGRPDKKRIYLIKAESACGKSHLIDELRVRAESVWGAQRFVCINLTKLSRAVTVSWFYDGIDHQVLPRQPAQPPPLPPSIQMEVRADLSGAKINDHNTISIGSPTVNMPQSKGEKPVPNSDPQLLIADLRKVTHPVAILLDTYEEALGETKDWIEQELLPVALKNKHLAIVVAGQKLPNHIAMRVAWGSVATHHPLPSIGVKDWHEYACVRWPDFDIKIIKGMYAVPGASKYPGMMVDALNNYMNGEDGEGMAAA